MGYRGILSRKPSIYLGRLSGVEGQEKEACSTIPCIQVMWDALMYAANMCYFYWVMNEAALAYDREE